ncbi:hypothetical protein [Streptomyces sp. NBC_00996]|uniref:hypothetical protein n=1 Tax=Streptomyces sp. NBC_00996 TaxID=2903710 RepID=UPI00386B9618|nr:hypothetical protein OG390_43180 [Streptomyces sp. NBC_00996]
MTATRDLSDGQAAPVIGRFLSTDAYELGVRVSESLRRSLRPLLGARVDGWSENTEPGPHYPQMDSLAGLAVVAPLAFFATRLRQRARPARGVERVR